MEVAICTRCQSSNPIFTKYCLTCGLVITSEMRHTVAVAPKAAKLAPAVSTVEVIPTTATTNQAISAQPGNTNQAETQTTEQPQPKKESDGWLKGFRFFSRS